MEFLDLIQHIFVFRKGSVQNLVIDVNPEGDNQGVPLVLDFLDEGAAVNEVYDPITPQKGATTVIVLVIQIVQCFLVNFSDVIVELTFEEVDGGLSVKNDTMVSCKAAQAQSRLAKVAEQRRWKTAVICSTLSYLLVNRQQLTMRPAEIGVGIFGIQRIGNTVLLKEKRV